MSNRYMLVVPRHESEFQLFFNGWMQDPRKPSPAWIPDLKAHRGIIYDDQLDAFNNAFASGCVVIPVNERAHIFAGTKKACYVGSIAALKDCACICQWNMKGQFVVQFDCCPFPELNHGWHVLGYENFEINEEIGEADPTF